MYRIHNSSVQSLSHVRLFATPWIAARQASLSITNSWSSPKLTCIESVMPSSHLILYRPFSSCPQSLPASGSFPMSQLFAWGGQNIGVSASAISIFRTHTLMVFYFLSWIEMYSFVIPQTLFPFFGTLQSESKFTMKVKVLVAVSTSWTIACQASLSMEFSKQE